MISKTIGCRGLAYFQTNPCTFVIFPVSRKSHQRVQALVELVASGQASPDGEKPEKPKRVGDFDTLL